MTEEAARRRLPPRKFLLRILRYEEDSGLLYWRERTVDMFDKDPRYRERSCKIWNTRFPGTPALNSVGPNGYRVGVIERTHFYAHRVIWKMVYGEEPECIDHINGDGRDNRIGNLRAVCFSENLRNKKLPRSSRTGTIGVVRRPNGRFQASIKVGGVRETLGTFDSIGEAAAARKMAEKKYGFHQNHGRAE